MSDSWQLYFDDALAAHRAGQHELASRLVRQHKLTRERPGQRLARAIARALLQEARRATQQQEFYRAWTALHEARLMSPSGIAFRQERTRLIEKTLTAAERRVCRGEMPQAKEILRHFERFHIAEPRAIRLATAVEQIEQARKLAVEGRFGEAARCVDRAIQMAPKLQSYQHQRDILLRRRTICQREIERLRTSLVAEAWSDVQSAAESLLRIAPGLQMARDAEQIASLELTRQMKPHDDESGSLSGGEEMLESHHHRQTDRRDHRLRHGSPSPVSHGSAVTLGRPLVPQSNVTAHDSTAHDSTVGDSVNETTSAISDPPENTRPAPETIQRRFVMWIDGVGGYLVCTENEISLGQALPDGGVDIPLQGDLSRRHLKFHRSSELDAVEPFGDVSIAGQPVTERSLLKNNDELELGRGVMIKYRRPHPLSTSARLDLQSRHRTHPWTDGILLMGDSLILGSHGHSHVRCLQWDQELIFFRRNEQIWVRCTSAIEVDGELQTEACSLTMDSRIVGQQFAISFERC